MADYMENDMSPSEIIARGHRPEDVKRVVELIPEGTRVPHEFRGRFAYAYENMTAVRVEVTEGAGSRRDEVAVIGKPDPVRTEIVKAVIVLKQGVAGTEALKAEIQNMVRQRLSTHSYPREIDFVASLPKTPSGKIQRFILRGEAR